MNTSITKPQHQEPAPLATSSGMAAEQSQAVAKIQAALTIAAARPRDELNAIAKIVKSCQRKGLAEKADWAFKKGNDIITGPSILLATVIATHWCNLKFGFREIGGGDGFTEVEAFAWDLENNTEATRLFKVYNRRYTGKGKAELVSERDIYENMASQAQRRVRACIQQVVPDDVFELALAECQKTLHRADPRSLEEKIQWLIVHFAKLGVSKDMIEGHLGHPLQAAVPNQVTTLGKVYQSIKDGLATREEVFSTPQAQPERMVPKEKKEHGDTEKPNNSAARTTPDTAHGNPGVDRPFNPVEELHGLAMVTWGARANENLKTACVGQGIELDKITDEQASVMIDILSGLAHTVGTPREERGK